MSLAKCNNGAVKILVTGGAGFLGSHLCEALLSLGHTVTALDDLSTGSLRNIDHLRGNQNFEFIEHDVRTPFEIDAELILNFACPASPVHYQSDPVRTMETNFLGIVNVLHLARESGAAVLQASTSEVYGDPTISPQDETYWGNVNPVGIRSCYDEGKRAAETLCFDYMRQYGVDARVVRIFNTYGPRMALDDGRVVSNLVVQSLRNEEMTIYGDGSQTRSFCYVEDLVRVIIKIALHQENIQSPINIGNPNEFTIRELAEMIRKKVNPNLNISYIALPGDDPKQRRPDLTLVRNIFGWNPTIELEEGLDKTIKYFRRTLETS
jgi:UDP-glucuronate decarboxylase